MRIRSRRVRRERPESGWRVDPERQSRVGIVGQKSAAELVRSMLEHVPVLAFIFNSDRRVIYANPWAARALGIPRGVLEDRGYLEVHPDCAEMLRAECDELMSEPDVDSIGPLSAEFRVRNGAGEWRWLRAHSSVFFDANEERRLATIAEDITELREIQRSRARSNQSVATFIVDLAAVAGRVRSVDRQFESISGRGASETVGLSVPEIFGRIYEPGRTELCRLLSDARRGVEGSAQVFWQSSTGVGKRANLRFVPIMESGSFANAAVGIVSSIRSEELEDADVDMRVSERLLALGRFSAGLSHELNNPLGTILLTTERALSIRQSKQLRECLTDVLGEVKRCVAIVRSLYRFSRGEDDKRSWCDVNQIVRCAIDSLYAMEKKSRTTTSLDYRIPMVQVDAMAIELALINLIRNAYEASNHGSPVEISTASRNAGVLIRVADRGRGLSSEERIHIFDPFYSTRRDKGGTGIGLSVVHGVIASHRGTITFDDRRGGGTLASIWLPVDTNDEPIAS